MELYRLLVLTVDGDAVSRTTVAVLVLDSHCDVDRLEDLSLRVNAHPT